LNQKVTKKKRGDKERTTPKGAKSKGPDNNTPGYSQILNRKWGQKKECRENCERETGSKAY